MIIFPAAYADKNKPKHSPDRLLVKFKENVLPSKQKEIIKGNGASIIKEIPKIKVKILKVPEQSLEKLEWALSKNKLVEYVEKDYLLEPSVIPNDPIYSSQWHLSKIEMEKAWEITKGNSSPIAILDSGIEMSHPDLQNKLVPGYNFYDDNNDLTDLCKHGTWVSGTAAAITDNGEGVSGVAWENPIMPIKITGPDCYGYYSAMIDGIIFAADNGARTANISYHIFNGEYFAFKDAAQYMYEKGGWVVGAAGNTGKFEDYEENPYLISVSSTNGNDVTSGFSSSGPYVDFSAPGSGIYTTWVNGNYGAVSGTSFAAPITAAVISLLFSYDPNLTPDEVYEILKNSSMDLGQTGYDVNYGWGRINAYQALLSINPEIDLTAPTVSITNPADGSTVSGNITVGVSAQDNDSISKVELYLDDVLYGISTAAPYEFAIDTTTLSNANHTLKSIAYDNSNNDDWSAVTVNVDNYNQEPKLSITNPIDESEVNGKVLITIDAIGFSHVPKIRIYIDDVLTKTLTNQPFEYSWHTRGQTSGKHIISAETDVDGKIVKDSKTVNVKEKGRGNENPKNPNKKN